MANPEGAQGAFRVLAATDVLNRAEVPVAEGKLPVAAGLAVGLAVLALAVFYLC